MNIRLVIDCGRNSGLVHTLLKEYKYYDETDPTRANTWMAKSVTWRHEVVTIIANDVFMTMFQKLLHLVDEKQIKSVRIDQGARKQ